MSAPSTDKTPPLHPTTVQRVRATRLGISLDWWSVIGACVLALLAWTKVLPKIPW